MSNLQYLGAGAEPESQLRSTSQYFIAAGTIAAGDFVMHDISQTDADKTLYVLEADVVANGNTLAFGVALGAAVAGETIEVCTGGYCAVASVTTGIAAGLGVVVDTTAGRGDVAAATDLVSPIATVCTLAAANVADVIVHRRF